MCDHRRERVRSAGYPGLGGTRLLGRATAPADTHLTECPAYRTPHTHRLGKSLRDICHRFPRWLPFNILGPAVPSRKNVCVRQSFSSASQVNGAPVGSQRETREGKNGHAWPISWSMGTTVFGKAYRSGGGVGMTRQKTLRCGPASRHVEQANAGLHSPARMWIHKSRRPAAAMPDWMGIAYRRSRQGARTVRLCYCMNETPSRAADTEAGTGARSLVGEKCGGRSDEP